MGIFRFRSPVWSPSSESLENAHSNLSSDEMFTSEEVESELKRVVVEPVPQLLELDKDTEICQVKENCCRLPHDLFQIEDLSKVLSLDTWNQCLMEEERVKLCSFLPSMDEETFQQTLRELLGGANMNFGSPLVDLLHQLKAGCLSPKIKKYQEASRFLERVEHYHHLRQYQNDMVNLFGEMQRLWLEHPEADVDDKMQLWHAHKSPSGVPNHLAENLIRGKAGLAEKDVSRLAKKEEESEDDSTELTLEARQKMLSQRDNYSRQFNPELKGVSKQMKPKEPFLLVKHNSSVGFKPSVYENQRVSKSLGKKKMESMKAGSGNRIEEKVACLRTGYDRKAEGNKKFLFKTNRGKNLSSMGRNKFEAVAKHVSDLEDRKVVVKRHNEGRVERSSNDWKSLSGSQAEGELSTSEELDALTDITSSEVPSSKRLRRGSEDYSFPEEIRVGPLNPPIPSNTSYRIPRKSARQPSPTPNFSFSVLHLLSAVRVSLLDSSQLNSEELPAILFEEVCSRVRANPGDIRVLSAQEPLEGLVRGALKVLSCKVLQPAVKGWKPLVAHDKIARGWCWVGPLPDSIDMGLVETDAQAWCISEKMLTKIQEAFISWFRSAQGMLRLLAQLSAPPLPSRPFVLNEKDRFQGLRAQRSLITINPTTNEMRAYFQQEEAIRYSLQDTVFFYTTACGEKSAVAPLKRLGGKPNSKARDHIILKSDRPSHVTILYLVRDAAARLPRSTGTRADVAVLLRDSQYIMEEATDAQLSQVVSGALDRLRYERDPCVQFDADRKLWVYLHANREEEDFEDDGTSSTKRWKRGKKEVGDSFEASVGPDHGLSGAEIQDKFAVEPGYNSSPSSFAGSGDYNYTADTPELLYNHRGTSLASGFPGQMRDDSVMPLIDLSPSIQSCTNMQSHPMGWEVYR